MHSPSVCRAQRPQENTDEEREGDTRGSQNFKLSLTEPLGLYPESYIEILDDFHVRLEKAEITGF